MTSRRDWQLQQLGITQWALRRPAVLQGEIAITLPAHIRLVMVADAPPPLTEPLLQDILRAMTLSPDQVLQLTPERAAMLPEDDDRRCATWCLGGDDAPALHGAQLMSPTFTDLQHSAPARAALWRQICEHEHDFLTHPE